MFVHFADMKCCTSACNQLTRAIGQMFRFFKTSFHVSFVQLTQNAISLCLQNQLRAKFTVGSALQVVLFLFRASIENARGRVERIFWGRFGRLTHFCWIILPAVSLLVCVYCACADFGARVCRACSRDWFACYAHCAALVLGCGVAVGVRSRT